MPRKHILPWLKPDPKIPPEIDLMTWTDIRRGHRSPWYFRLFVFSSMKKMDSACTYMDRSVYAQPKEQRDLQFTGRTQAAVYCAIDFKEKDIAPKGMVGFMVIPKNHIWIPSVYGHELIHISIAHDRMVNQSGCLDYVNINREEEFAYLYGDYLARYMKWLDGFSTELQTP